MEEIFRRQPTRVSDAHAGDDDVVVRVLGRVLLPSCSSCIRWPLSSLPRTRTKDNLHNNALSLTLTLCAVCEHCMPTCTKCRERKPPAAYEKGRALQAKTRGKAKARSLGKEMCDSCLSEAPKHM